MDLDTGDQVLKSNNLDTIEIPSVLVVEDEKELETFFTHVIRGVNYQSVFVKSVAEAMSLLRQRRFSLIVSDHFLEGKATGLDLWKICQKRWPEIPFLLTSAMGTPKFLKLTSALTNPPSFLPKPFYQHEFRYLINQMLQAKDSPLPKEMDHEYRN